MRSDISYKQSGSDWLGDVPSHWEVMRLKHLGFFKGGAGFPIESQGQTHHGLPFFKVKDISGAGEAGYMTEADSTVSPEIAQGLGARIFPVDTIAFAKVGAALLLNRFRLIGRPACMDNNMMGYIIDRDGVSARFVWWMMHRVDFADVVNPGTVPSLNEPLISNIFAALPPLDEQITIASYLDAETKRIDGLIAEKERLTGLLHELRGGVIRERTAGLDRSDHRHNTGNQFTPTLPDGWSLVALGRYASITNGSTPLKDNAAFWEGGTYPWLNSAVVNGDEVTEGSELVTPEALRLCHLPVVPAGSVLVALTGQGKTRGQATVLRIEATINQHLAAIVCDPDHLDGEFLFWTLTGQYAALRMVSDGQGGTKGALTCDELGSFPIPKPPISLQRSIAKALYEETRKIDELIQHVRNEVAVLQELRSSTITDAVLGRIDVRPT